MEWIEVFAPATVGNVGPGYDVLGLALGSPGDRIRAKRVPGTSVTLKAVHGDGPLPPPTDRNTAVVAAREIHGEVEADWGVELELFKGLPVGSGLGSSGASAVAAAFAVNQLADRPLDTHRLVAACALAEAAACGTGHADNVAPALLGGVVVVRADGSATKIETGLPLGLAMVTPQMSLATRTAREAIPAEIPIKEAVHNISQVATLVYALASSDVALLKGAFIDLIAEPRRAPLIPGFHDVKRAAEEGGALGASISGAGPSIFAICESNDRALDVEKRMSAALAALGIEHRSWATPLSQQGAHVVDQG